ncbi:MAG: threonine/serine exporter family protein [Cruoricaptor ignavus]|nr:threonine/serine exporter family protein [Cruoricaptor ignavus]
MEIPFDIIEKIFWAICVSIGFAVMFNTPKRALWVVGLLGAIGFGIKITLLRFAIPEQVVIASLAGATAVGILGVYFAHRVHTPPIVFTVPAVINMIPGKFGYEFIIGLLKIVSFGKEQNTDFSFFLEVMNNGLKTGFILFALAFGVIFPLLMFNTPTVKNKDLHKLINKKVIRRAKAMHYKRARKKQG